MVVPILLSVDSGYVRLAFRIYFTVVIALIGFFANMCLSRLSRRSIANGISRPLPAMSGWLSNMNLVYALFKLRSLPGGLWFGTLMILCSVLSLLSDFAVSGLIQTVNVHGRCSFGTGLIIPYSFSSDGWWLIPPFNGAPYLVVANAQITSAANGGLVGVYWKANRDIHFQADDVDLAGSWGCTEEGDIIYPADMTMSEITGDLFQRGYLYHLDAPGCSTHYGNGTFSHFIRLDSSVGNVTGSIFDVRASIDSSPYGPGAKTMKNFRCTMNGTGISWVLEHIKSGATLALWCLGLQANVYNGAGTGANNNSGAALEQYLNSIIMVAGGKDSLLSTPTTEGGGPTQGCHQQRTSIPAEILIMFAVVTFALLSVATILLVLFILERQMESVGSNISQPMPNDLVGWMVQAVQEYRGQAGTTGDELRNWAFGRWPTGLIGITFIGHRRQRNSGRNVPEEEMQLTRYY